jgi:hypothetical protein
MRGSLGDAYRVQPSTRADPVTSGSGKRVRMVAGTGRRRRCSADETLLGLIDRILFERCRLIWWL